MPMLIALFIVALVTVTKPFRGLASGSLVLAGVVCIGIVAILWRFWIDLSRAIASAWGRAAIHDRDEESHHTEIALNTSSPRLGELIPLRLPVPVRGKLSRSRRPD